MNKERLLNVARALRESPNPDRFDMSMYVHSCGTPACALGHYAHRTDLQDVFVIDEDGDLLVREDGGLRWAQNPMTAADIHFGLAREFGNELFDTDGCGGAETAIEAAEYIERFVARFEA